MNKLYDVIIIGAGPAGLTAGLYTSRNKLSTLLIEKGIIGGNINEAEKVDNYPGFPQGISGIELTTLMHEQAVLYGTEELNDEVITVKTQDKIRIVKTSRGDFSAKALIIAGGSERQKMNVPGEKEFTGKGVSYCATCDAPFFREKKVAIIGGGNAAIFEALHVAKFASKVNIIHRRNELRATAIVQDKAFAEPKIEFIWNTVVTEVEGEIFIKRLKLADVNTGEESSVEIDGVFVAIGLIPSTSYLKDIVALDNMGYIIVNDRMETNVPGIFAAGDIRSNSIRQVISAAGDGATAAFYANIFIEK
ncbi:MAG: thioredoxin-disulfide reductase [Dehalococcoidales bacterium]|jgi:thioredoxin reductase (NADPH)|nr:thioredoxin-disulfide reductase [Dehalococcoidales bacterium]